MITSVVRRRSDVVWRDLPGLLIVGEVEGAITVAEGAAAAVWRLAEHPHTVPDLVIALASTFSVAPAEIQVGVEEFVLELVSRGLLIRE